MNLEAVIALVVGTVVVLSVPAVLLSTDILERIQGSRNPTQER
jgi:hypothetical protein